MSWLNQVTDVLQNYSQTDKTPPDHEVESHFHQVAQAAPSGDLANGLSAMFHSDQTPPFGQMVGQLFSHSNGAQKANLLNTLLSSGAGAGILAQLAQAAGVSIPTVTGDAGRLTPEAADQVPADAVQKAAAHAKEQDPSVVDRVSEIYAQHPMLVKSLGAAAMAIAMSHFTKHRG